jgi:Asp-tRNA(Asn)/Glu-tRNA(Gln) amidotransferase A subunit family amidase
LKEHNIDFVISPTGFGEKPPKISDILNPAKDEGKSPVFEYKQDYYTVISNCLGAPNLTVPLFETPEAKDTFENFPGSFRMMGYFGEDFHMIRMAQRIEKILEINGMSAK